MCGCCRGGLTRLTRRNGVRRPCIPRRYDRGTRVCCVGIHSVRMEAQLVTCLQRGKVYDMFRCIPLRSTPTKRGFKEFSKRSICAAGRDRHLLELPVFCGLSVRSIGCVASAVTSFSKF